ncbi:cyclic AMP-responsive element-binding protein 3-like protein 3 isoform X6 [Artemia franciscana]|uniref:cyclic AMP-responsive element-binding protein 3-like protein 3 isoform X6 n=1 Tax=Artemia franciscana TaxID=6661 RepID=UPI0032DB6A78
MTSYIEKGLTSYYNQLNAWNELYELNNYHGLQSMDENMAAISGGDGDLTSFLNEPQFSGDVSKNLVVASKSKPVHEDVVTSQSSCDSDSSFYSIFHSLPNTHDVVINAQKSAMCVGKPPIRPKSSKVIIPLKDPYPLKVKENTTVKIAAQESRRKKKEYIEELEEQMKKLQTENQQLKEKLELCMRKNKTLMDNLKKLEPHFPDASGELLYSDFGNNLKV